MFASKTRLTYAFVAQQPLSIPSWNVDTRNFMISTMSILNHSIANVIVWAALRQWNGVVHAAGLVRIKLYWTEMIFMPLFDIENVHVVEIQI